MRGQRLHQRDAGIEHGRDHAGEHRNSSRARIFPAPGKRALPLCGRIGPRGRGIKSAMHSRDWAKHATYVHLELPRYSPLVTRRTSSMVVRPSRTCSEADVAQRQHSGLDRELTDLVRVRVRSI
jgi:hypothetical protein